MTDGRLSSKAIPPNERLIVPLDVPDHDEALRLVDLLGDGVTFYKVGLELFLAGDYRALVGTLRDRGKEVFLDLKLFDVPNTVAAAVRQVDDSGARFVTVHGNDAILEAACSAAQHIGVLGVTVLTSLDAADLEDLGFATSVEKLVVSRARRALRLGCAGVVSSGLEVPSIRDEVGEKLAIVVPGVRPVANDDDQKRVVTPEDAFLAGADHIVVGRPIREAPDPRAAAARIQESIAELFG